jgi:hypothetical protein
VAWDLIAALAAPVTLSTGTIAGVGEKWLFGGQVLLEVTDPASPYVRMMAPFDDAAADGRQTIAPFVRAGIVRKTIHYRPDISIRFYDTLIGLVIGGPVKRGRIRATAGAHSLAAGPTFAELATLFPRLILVGNLRGAHT